MFAAATLLRRKIEQRSWKQPQKLARRVWSFVSEEGLCCVGVEKETGRGQEKRRKKRIKTRCRVNPDNQKEKCSTSSQITGNVKEILRV
jgi:hypothetical protein